MIGKIEFIQRQHSGNFSDFGYNALIQRQRIIESLAARAVHDQKIPMHPAQVGHAHFLKHVFAVNIPEDQRQILAIRR